MFQSASPSAQFKAVGLLRLLLMRTDVLRLFGEVSNNLDCMKRFIGQYYVLVVSDIARDGLGVELWDNEHNLVAEVFRCDANNTVLLNTFKMMCH